MLEDQAGVALSPTHTPSFQPLLVHLASVTRHSWTTFSSVRLLYPLVGLFLASHVQFLCAIHPLHLLRMPAAHMEEQKKRYKKKVSVNVEIS